MLDFFAAEELERQEREKQEIHQEYEQERIAYQKLLKELNRAEQQCENLQVKKVDVFHLF